MLGGYSFVIKSAFILPLRIEDEQKARRERVGVGAMIRLLLEHDRDNQNGHDIRHLDHGIDGGA
jgi:hypothetical protein